MAEKFARCGVEKMTGSTRSVSISPLGVLSRLEERVTDAWGGASPE